MDRDDTGSPGDESFAGRTNFSMVVDRTMPQYFLVLSFVDDSFLVWDESFILYWHETVVEFIQIL